jgi:two-component system response regulator (stage 0 sporulation protein F)
VDTIKKNNDELKQLNEEHERVLEVIAQNLRQPLIDQMNWCELLISDTEHGLHATHLETTGRINRAAEDMLARVLELLDAESIEQSASAGREAVPESEEAADAIEQSASAGREVVSGSQEAADASEVTDPIPLAVGFGADPRTDFKILLVEDSSTLRDTLASVLRQRFHVLSATDGWEALRLMVEQPDLILTELDLPCVDAPEMLRHARRMAADVPVLAMYGPEDKALLAAARPLGVKHALLKPFHIADLVRQVEALVDASTGQMRGSVLVVCPDATERCALYHLFDTRYRTHIAASTEAAMELADTHFDLLVVDVAAGEFPWQEVVTVFRKQHRYIKVLALTDGREGAALEALKKAGVESAMPKPYGFDDLLLRVQDLLGIKRVDRRVFRSVFRKLA